MITATKGSWLASLIVSSALILSAQAQASAAPDDAAATADQQALENTPGTSEAQHSPGVDEVLKMVKAGVSKGVIVSYVQRSDFAYRLTSEDLISLKENSVPDEITTAMLERGTELSKAAKERRRTVISANSSSAPQHIVPSARIDPESYDFWWYHYAYPRALAYANRRMLSAYTPLTRAQRLNYYSRLPYGPQAPSFFRHQ